MQEDSGKRKSTQPGWPARQLQIRHHPLRFAPHCFSHCSPRCGLTAAGLLPASPLSSSGAGNGATPAFVLVPRGVQ